MFTKISQSEMTKEIRNNIAKVFGNILYTNSLEDDLNTVAVALHKDYFSADCTTDCGENPSCSKSKEALSYWLGNLRSFNQMMDERTGEVLLDGNVAKCCLLCHSLN